MKRFRVLFGLGALVLGSAIPAFTMASTVSADTTGPASASTPSVSFPDCFTVLVPIHPGAEATSSDVGPTLCYSSMANLEQAKTLTPDTTFVIGQDYMDTNYGGTMHEYDGGAQCSASIGYGDPGMPSGWNDDVSSARSGLANCNDFVHYENANYNNNVSGATVDCSNDSCYFIGAAMNDRTSSETWNT